MPISAASAPSFITRATTTLPKRQLVAAYAYPTRLAFIRSYRAANPAAAHARTTGPSAPSASGSLSSSLTYSKAAVSSGARGFSTTASALAAAPGTPPTTTLKDTPSSATPRLPATEAPPAEAPILRPDPSIALQKLSLSKLFTVWLVYKMCASPSLVRMSPAILSLFEKLHLSWLSDAVVRRTFFDWFCAGEKEGEIVQTMRDLKESGIGSILDFSAEADLDSSVEAGSAAARAQANVKADAFAKEYLHGLQMSEQVPGSFAAIKVTGLTGPEVLYRLSMPYMPMRSAFERADFDADAKIDYKQFKDVLLPSMPGGSRVSSPSGVFSMVDTNNDGLVDWVDIQMALGLDNPLARPLYLSAAPSSEYGATEADLEDYERLVSRTRTVMHEANKKNVRIMVDAEHTYFQPMIDHVATLMQREFNSIAQAGKALVYNTYQMYRADSNQRMAEDYERSIREGWQFSAKLVRGAYMELERARAEKLGYASPINPTIEATHECYDRGVQFLVEKIAEAQNTGSVSPIVFVASHNRESIEKGLGLINQHAISLANEPVMFGQLLSMQDAVSYALAKMNIPIYKYVPYGPLKEVMPYLIRRARENSAVATSIRAEASMVMSEIKARMSGNRSRNASSTSTVY